jgi:hypothetical protein
MDNFQQMIAFMEKTLSTAQKERNKNKWIESDLEWVIFERETMFKAVNYERSKLGKSPITLLEITNAENSACGY